MATRVLRWAACFAIGVLFLGAACRCEAQSSELRNPFLNAADPFVTRVNSKYLLLATYQNSITIWSGGSLGSLSSNPKLIWKPGDDLEQVWSPTLWHIDGRWWIYFTAEHRGGKHAIFVLQSNTDEPLGAYTFRGELALGRPAIDPSLVRVNDKNYLMYVQVDHGANSVWITELAAPMTPAGPNRSLISPDQPWERGDGTSHNYPVSEGPTALYHAGKTFIVYSGSDTGTYVYCLGLLTYRGTGDPTEAQNWKKSGPVFSYSASNGVYAPGRGTFTTSADGSEDWIVYHAKATRDYTYAGRSLRAQTFTWKPDGDPDFGVPVPAGALASK